MASYNQRWVHKALLATGNIILMFPQKLEIIRELESAEFKERLWVSPQ